MNPIKIFTFISNAENDLEHTVVIEEASQLSSYIYKVLLLRSRNNREWITSVIRCRTTEYWPQLRGQTWRDVTSKVDELFML